MLRRGRFLTGEYNEDLEVDRREVAEPDGDELTAEQWDDPSMRCFGLVIDGRAQATGIRRPASDATLLLVVNAHHDVVDFTLPDIPGSDQWSCLIDTNAPMREELADFGSGDGVSGDGALAVAVRVAREGRDAADLQAARRSVDG